jgi:predicted O-methyltransferase YrrM
MSKTTLPIGPRLYEYLLSVSLRDTPVQQALRAETDLLEFGVMQISPDQGQFMALLVRLVNARWIIELGTFTGYSTLVMADALPPDGRIVACDIDKEWTEIARRYWQQAGVDDRIDLRLAPAGKTLRALLDAGEQEQYDLAFIDADKASMLNYYELCLDLIRPGGLIMIDNVLWGGSVADPNYQSPDVNAIRRFNEYVFQDERVDVSLVPIGDGLTLARKR